MKLRIFLALLPLALSPLAACQSSNTQANPSPSPIEERTAQAQTQEIQTPIFQKKGLAIKGADPVAYFTEGQATEGSSQFQYQWSGATWQFTSAENRDRFAANPESYAPQYGGHCAWAVSQGSIAPIDPEAWAIVDDKLYLNLNRNIQKRWEKDIYTNIAKADQNWPSVALN